VPGLEARDGHDGNSLDRVGLAAGTDIELDSVTRLFRMGPLRVTWLRQSLMPAPCCVCLRSRLAWHAILTGARRNYFRMMSHNDCQ
jgi:hypothetical protein